MPGIVLFFLQLRPCRVIQQGNLHEFEPDTAVMNNKLIPPLSLLSTLGLIWLIPSSLALLLILPLLWYISFRPLEREDLLIYIMAGVFIIVQNYAVLRTGAFVFAQQDFLLMPYYEPLLWGFYFLNLKRFFAGQKQVDNLEWRAIAGLVLISLAFGIFSGTSWHTAAVFVAAGILLIFFHRKEDLYFALYTLGMGFVVELFGVKTGKWFYPEPDMLGMPFWFAPMWISVGLLGRRFLLPLMRLLDRRLPCLKAYRQ